MSPFPGEEYHAKGKLLLTGEYFVLDGAMALALPTRLGQHFKVEAGKSGVLTWQSYDVDGTCWFNVTLEIPSLKIVSVETSEPALRLIQVLEQAFLLSKLPLTSLGGCSITTHLDFSRHWGLGSSSTLISFVAHLAQVNPYDLLAKTFGGSGYDLACALAEGPIIYQNQVAQPVAFHPAFADQLYFVYLGKKQNSREGIQRYRALGEKVKASLAEINHLTLDIAACDSLEVFESLILQHELIVSTNLNLTRAQNLYFSDYWGVVKSLGAWGGDFVLVTSDQDTASTKNYFQEKGFEVILSYTEMIL
ncbi:MAG: GYDIA family GHMP kinase [Haliscomenobacter sp.]|uniref:GYDIA family GHMP kinase n=1 Tax=Haliscomenobacter sp. TaxID=2717303 RepID=UPI0029B1C41B|nr:GYDIA family GHMP kinase [Haliscomenobacter sp.]MDX2072056.1 GYDIA family GHMP kinase [Haliscomenobacter sp.]